jgi:hypothetical protein
MENAIQGTTIKNLVKQIGDNTLLVALSGMILHTANFFNLTKSMNDDQAIDTASLLIETYPHETIEDFTIMFREAKKGKYGELYNRLDGQLIFKWMGLYLEEKAKFREKQHQNMKSGAKDTTDLMQIVLEKGSETIKVSDIPNKSVIDALKEAINYKDDEKNEIDYMKFRSEYIKKNT